MISRVHRVCAVIVLASAVAHADPKAADRLADEANARAKQGDFAGAAAKFRAAHTEDPRPALICNVGVSYFKAKDLVRAQRYLQDCVQVAASVPPAFVATVKQVLAQLEDQLRAGPYAPVSFIVSPPQVTISNTVYDEPSVGSRLLWFPRGSYEVAFHADGYVDQTRTLDASHAQTMAVTLERTPVAVVVAPPTPVRPATVKTSRTLPVVLTVAAATEGAASLALYLLARSKAGDANRAVDARDQDAYDKAVKSAHTFQVASIIAVSAAAITAGVAGYFWYHDVSVEPQPGGAVVAIGGRF